MTAMSAAEIYAVALEAGFDPHQAVTFTAIALAESGGRTSAHAGRGEDSWGLWQINVASGVRSNRFGDLTDPLNNAKAAYEISRHGSDISPWTTTHDSNNGTAADYRRYREEAEAAAHGITGHWAGVHGYRDHGDGAGAGGTASATAHAAGQSSYDGIDAGAPLATAADGDHDGLMDDFERVAGTDPRQADTDHDGLSDGFEALRSHTDPLSADTDRDRLPDAVEWAQGSDAGHLAGVAGVAGSGAFRQSVRAGVADADHDGLSDRFEKATGTDPRQADTDRDGLLDALERALGTDPLSVDSDRDGLSDGLEVRSGSDPLHALGTALPAAAADEPHGGWHDVPADLGGH